MKICSKCHQSKPESEFPKEKRGRGGLRANCKACQNKYHRDYFFNQKARGRFNKLRVRAADKGIPFGLNYKEFEGWLERQLSICHYCGVKLTCPLNRHKQFTDRTFDRKDNNKGYTIDNLVLACARCNLIKSKWFTEEQMLEIAQKYFKCGKTNYREGEK